MLPILYSYRRCPYAMRARMALKLAGIEVEIREISLRDKPAHMLQVSPKGTVPVLILADGNVIDESLEIMFFALKEHTLNASLNGACSALILENDTSFKQALDAYKYPERDSNKSQIAHRADGEVFLQKLENLLSQNTYLLQAAPSMADIAIFPFVRQFAAVDSVWFESSPYPKLRAWLNGWIESELFKSVMQKLPVYTLM
jgi:glutathione S-transferase